MGVDVVSTPVVVDCTSIVLIVIENMGVDVVPTAVVVDSNASTMLELVLAEGTGVEVAVTPVVENNTSLVVLDLVVTEGMGVVVLVTLVVVYGNSVALHCPSQPMREGPLGIPAQSHVPVFGAFVPPQMPHESIDLASFEHTPSQPIDE